MKLKALTLEDCLEVVEWRNASMSSLRTPYLLTEDMQREFYEKVVSNRSGTARYYGIWHHYDIKRDNGTPIAEYVNRREYNHLIGMVGLEYIEWENRRAEISIILNPKYQHAGHGTEAVTEILRIGFEEMNLDNIWGECYKCNPACDFWLRIAQRYAVHGINSMNTIPNTKYFAGRYWDSFHFTINKEGYRSVHNNT